MNNLRHQDRFQKLLKEQAAEFFNREAGRRSLITVNDCRLANNSQHAVIYISVLPPDKSEEALNFAKRKRSDLKDFLITKNRGRKIPNVDVALIGGQSPK